MGRGCPELRVLNLSYCQEGCSDATLASFCSSARALRNLEMRGCRGVTALGLAAMASGCKSLEELDLKKCKGINDVGLIAISQGCQYLRQVRLPLLLSYSSVLSHSLLCPVPTLLFLATLPLFSVLPRTILPLLTSIPIPTILLPLTTVPVPTTSGDDTHVL